MEAGWRYYALATLLAAPYGATIGLWHGPRLGFYAAVKLPLVLLVTAALTIGACWIGARLSGWQVSFGAVVSLVLMPLAVAGALLASLSPVSLLFTLSAPPPGAGARLTHNVLYLTHTILIGVAALAGTVALRRRLRAVLGDRLRARRVLVSWLAIYAIVGGEVAWAFRPFVGSVYEEVRFLRPEPLDGNVYEFVLEDIVPYLAERADPKEDTREQ